MKDLVLEDFQPLVGQSFALHLADGTLGLVLEEARAHGDEPYIRGGRIPFSLTFRGPLRLPQAIYRLEHAAFGPLDIFIVPIAADAAGVRYEAVFA